jgi:hypothetical protein
MHSIRFLEIAALACKALVEVFHLGGRESIARRSPDEGAGERTRIAVVARRTIAAVRLSGSIYYLILLTEHLAGKVA